MVKFNYHRGGAERRQTFLSGAGFCCKAVSFVFLKVAEGETDNSLLLLIGADRDTEHLSILRFTYEDLQKTKKSA
jgi:hypothetical protein